MYPCSPRLHRTALAGLGRAAAGGASVTTSRHDNESAIPAAETLVVGSADAVVPGLAEVRSGLADASLLVDDVGLTDSLFALAPVALLSAAESLAVVVHPAMPMEPIPSAPITPRENISRLMLLTLACRSGQVVRNTYQFNINTGALPVKDPPISRDRQPAANEQHHGNDDPIRDSL